MQHPPIHPGAFAASLASISDAKLMMLLDTVDEAEKVVV